MLIIYEDTFIYMEKLAVVLPVYMKDIPEYVSLSVDSILNQSYINYKLFIGVDGPVEEDLAKQINTYSSNDKIEICWFPDNRGLPIILNDLVTKSFEEGFEFIARMDADDISLPERLQHQMDYLMKHPDIDVVGGWISEIDEKSELSGKIIHYPLSSEDCRAFFATRNPLAHPAVLFRKTFFEKAGSYNPVYRQNQDTILWYVGFMCGCKLANIPEVVLKFRVTMAMFKKRRSGYELAKRTLKDRLMINQDLGYGLKANIYAYLYFLMMISPALLKKIAYRMR